ncbi:MAG: hypothetical protein FD169_2036 [Bacillota bacterium]|nr:MAG: hypothetical protein FD169_2036 [Bacillota bacterium]MBS3949797.1 FMN-binding protein [Peptococcaceae bacterium]
MKKRRNVIITLILVVVVGAVVGKITFNNIAAAHQRLLDERIPSVLLSGIPDGTYMGSYSAFPVLAEVKVTVKAQTITDIELVKHRNGQGEWAEAILVKVVASQSLDVDVIAGATISSRVILRAIGKALER